jgi:hypothetical protein
MRVAIRPPVGIALASIVLLLASLSVVGCSGNKDEPRPAAAPAASAGASDEPLPPVAYESSLSETVRANLNKPFKGDLDEMVKRRVVRIGVTFNRTHYFVDKGVQRGAVYEYGKLMEDELNKRRKTGNLKVAFWFVPLPRDQLLPALVDGNVEQIASERIGRETVTYVSNIYKYYVAYRLITEEKQRRAAAMEGLRSGSSKPAE